MEEIDKEHKGTKTIKFMFEYIQQYGHIVVNILSHPQLFTSNVSRIMSLTFLFLDYKWYIHLLNLYILYIHQLFCLEAILSDSAYLHVYLFQI